MGGKRAGGREGRALGGYERPAGQVHEGKGAAPRMAAAGWPCFGSPLHPEPQQGGQGQRAGSCGEGGAKGAAAGQRACRRWWRSGGACSEVFTKGLHTRGAKRCGRAGTRAARSIGKSQQFYRGEFGAGPAGRRLRPAAGRGCCGATWRMPRRAKASKGHRDACCSAQQPASAVKQYGRRAARQAAGGQVPVGHLKMHHSSRCLLQGLLRCCVAHLVAGEE